MAIVATLNEAANRHSPSAHSIASIPLNKLVPWDGNVRKTGAAEGLDELIANIAAHGVLQSLVVKKTNRGKFAVIAGRRRFLALSSLAKAGTIGRDAPVPCRVVPGSADATEISLAENVVRAPMHPADQFVAFRALIDEGSTAADIAARFGISEMAVKQRLKLARVSPTVFEAYRQGELNLEQVQAFAVSDDHCAQERVFSELAQWHNDDPLAIRRALTQDEIAATDRRAKFVTVAAYEEAGGAVRRDLFAESDEGVFILDLGLLNRLAQAKLEAEAAQLRAQGWKWVEARLEFDYEARMEFRTLHPERLPLSEEAAAEQKRLSEEYHMLFENLEEGDEETSARLNEIEARVEELEDTESVYLPETLAVAGAVVTLDRDGGIDVHLGLVRPEDEPEEPSRSGGSAAREKPPFSASLTESLTSCRSLAIAASLTTQPRVALAAVVHALASSVFRSFSDESSLQLSVKLSYLRESCPGKDALQQAGEVWRERLPKEPGALWGWCIAQDQSALLELLAFCAAHAVDAVQRKADRPDCGRLNHAGVLAASLNLDMAQWFTPTKENYFSRVGRSDIVCAITEAKAMPAKRSWDKLKKAELAELAEREVAGSTWLPQPLRAA